MTDQKKLNAYERTLGMLESTSKMMACIQEHGGLSEHGDGSLHRAQNTIKWLKGELGNEVEDEEANP